jgi:ribose transport system substrate-binding protein
MKATLSTDNVQGGRLAADALAKAIAEKYQTASGEVAIVNYLSGAGSVTERSNGFKDQLFAKYPHLSVVDERDGNGTNATAEQNAASILQSRPNLRGLFATNVNAADAAGAALKAAGLADKIKLVGFDSDDKLISYLTDGTIAALIVQDPYRMGYEGVKTAYEASQGRGVLQYIDTGANVVTRDNMNGEREKQLLHPAVN